MPELRSRSLWPAAHRAAPRRQRDVWRSSIYQPSFLLCVKPSSLHALVVTRTKSTNERGQNQNRTISWIKSDFGPKVVKLIVKAVEYQNLKRRELLVKASRLGLLESAAAGIAFLDGSARSATSFCIRNPVPVTGVRC